MSVWCFCGARITEKIDPLNKRFLRFDLQDYYSPYDSLLNKVNSKSLYKRSLQTFLNYIVQELDFLPAVQAT